MNFVISQPTVGNTSVVEITDSIITKFDVSILPNGVFGKLPSHQMAVAIMCLIGKEIREIHFGHRALPYILCAYKYIQCL